FYQSFFSFENQTIARLGHGSRFTTLRRCFAPSNGQHRQRHSHAALACGDGDICFSLLCEALDSSNYGSSCGVNGASSSIKAASQNHENNMLFQGLCLEGHLGEALELLGLMPTPLSSTSYLSFLAACCKEKSLAHITNLYAYLQRRRGCLRSLGNQIVAAFATCGGIQEACDLAWTLQYRTVLSWTAIISAYTAAGQAEEALRMHDCMLQDGVESNTYTFVSLLKACGIIGELEQGRRLHAIAHFRNFTSRVHVGSTLVRMYAKCGVLMDAEHAFLGISDHNDVSWSAMIAGYSEQGKGQKALLLYRQMKHQGLLVSERTLVSVLEACGAIAKSEVPVFVQETLTKVKALDITQALHADAKKLGFTSDVFISSALVSAYGRCGATVEAEHVFMSMPQHNKVSWCAILSAHVESGQGKKALWLYKEALNNMIIPDPLMYIVAFQACSALADKVGQTINDVATKKASLEIGRALHTDANSKGYASEAPVGNTLIRMYGKCGAVDDAESAFDALFRHDVVSFNALLSVFVEQNEEEKAFSLYSQLLKQIPTLDSVAYICILQAAGAMGNLKMVHYLQYGVICAGLEDDLNLAATLIHSYNNCGCMKDGEVVFFELPRPHMGSWNACISGHAGEGSLLATTSMFSQLILASVKPDRVALTSVLSCCSHAGVIMDGLDFFTTMWEDFDVPPDIKHFGALLDLLGRTGVWSRLKDVLSKMPMEADNDALMSVLSSCCRHGDRELADYVFDHAVGLQPANGTAYVLISNLYADSWLPESEAEMG
ncbi:hypothetical protein GOP47_0004661, partial [Adiantum capillus-veneris]